MDLPSPSPAPTQGGLPNGWTCANVYATSSPPGVGNQDGQVCVVTSWSSSATVPTSDGQHQAQLVAFALVVFLLAALVVQQWGRRD